MTAAEAVAKYGRKTASRVKAKQEGGDDGYCWVVRIDGKVFVDGLTQSQVPYYRRQALEIITKDERQ